MTYKTAIKIIDGKQGAEIMLFALSTCIWCKKTKALLAELGLKYSYVDVDLLDDADQDEVYDEIEKHDSNASFPFIIINNGEKIIVGFDESEIKKLYG